MNIPQWPGWHLIGAFDSDVGSWLLHHNDEAMLLEIPEGLTVEDVRAALKEIGSPRLKYVTASHDHEDHLDTGLWVSLEEAFPDAIFLRPMDIRSSRLLVGGEPLYLIKAPKHSPTDTVTIFRGVAMTGDIELGMLESVNDEVPARVKRRSMKRLAEFPARTGHRVHSIVSAHLDDVRLGVDWPSLFGW